LALKNEELEGRIKNADATNANLSKMIDDLMNLEVKNKELSKMNEDLNKSVQDLENACKDLEGQIPKGNLNELISELQGTINKLRRRNKKLQSEIEDMKK
jgi:predicted  nucleic acid-binding Zn-ribbon protein